VRLGDAERIDLVVDGILAIEVDGDEFHRDRFEEDRSKDLAITTDHLHALRPSARTIFYRWPTFALAVDTALADHGIRLQNSGQSARSPFSRPDLSGWRHPHSGQSPEL